MPQIKSNNLIGLPVVTESGQHLGTVRSFDIDIDAHTIVRYDVKPSGIVATMMGRSDVVIMIIQVVSITKEQMTVRDNVVPQKEKRRKRMILEENPLPVLQRTTPRD